MADFNVQVVVDPARAKQGSRQVRSELESIETSADRMRKTITRAFQFIGVGAAVRQLVQLADTFTNMRNRLKNVVSGQAALNKQTEELFQIAQRTRSSFESTVELYARVGLAAKELGRTQEELTAFTESLNQAIALSGASGAEAQAGLIQLSQGLASGTLRGDELNSVLEQLPAVADVISKHLKVTRGELRNMGSEGKITADIVLDAFKSARGELADRFAKTVPTISRAFQVFRNALVKTVGSFDQMLGPSRSFAKIVILLANNMDTLVRATAALAITIGVNLAAQALPKAIAGIRALTAVIAANPIGAIAVALTAVISLLTTFSDQISLSADGVVTLQDYAVAAFQFITEAIGPIAQAIHEGFTMAIARAQEILAGFGLTFKDVLNTVKVAVNNIIGYYVGMSRASQIIFKKIREVILSALGSEVAQHIIEVFKGVFDFLVDRFKAFANFAIRAMELVGISVGGLWDALDKGPKEVRFKIGPEGGAEEIKSFGTQVKDAFLSGFQQDYVGDFIDIATPAFEALQKRARGVAIERTTEQVESGTPIAAPVRTAPTAAETKALKAQMDLYKQIKKPIEEYSTTLSAANALLEQGKISAQEYSAALKATQLGGELQQLQMDLLPEGDQQLAALEQTLQQRLDLLSQFQEAKLISEQDALSMSERIHRQHNAEVQSIEAERYKMQLNAGSQAFGALSKAVKGFVGEQSKSYRALFALSKGFAAAETTVAIAQGIANSAKLGWPANIPAIAGVISQTAGLVSQIQGAQFTGSYQTGGSFRVGGSGGADSQLVAFRATPNETVSVRTPSQQKSSEAAPAAPTESSGIRIVNVTDPGLLEDYLTSPAGERTLVNAIQRNGSELKQVLR